MTDLIKQAFDVLKEWPLVQGAVAILVLAIATLLAWSAIRKQMPRRRRSPSEPSLTRSGTDSDRKPVAGAASCRDAP
ncbi:hypothetical protein [Bradyrhizobium symbiodeficiens]|uniref:Uncharacterized protein n=1 Tax=Bradyrhizobium symbiodeficiens TaxID=1404367 RepID=A0A6G9AB50_9BRAD|nr:hypothetical protein [Bradyrhizobium symbiodeficiens]QIP09539.1 hypothetical protein HAV00_26280 [Bradyrhizobium symbiodeficiens]